MDDQDARRAAPRALLELVRPAAVVGHRLAVEQRRVELRRIGRARNLRIVDEHQDRLALDVDVLEVVPVEFGSRDAVAGEDQLRVLDRRGVGDALRPRHEVVAPAERRLLAAAGDRQRPRVGGGDAHERQGLNEGAVGVAWLEADLREGVLQELDGELLALRSRRASLELVGREHLDVLEHSSAVERRRLGDGDRGRGTGGGWRLFGRPRARTHDRATRRSTDDSRHRDTLT